GQPGCERGARRAQCDPLEREPRGGDARDLERDALERPAQRVADAALERELDRQLEIAREPLVDCVRAHRAGPPVAAAPLALLAPRRRRARPRCTRRARRERLLEPLQHAHHVAAHLRLHLAPARLALLAPPFELLLEYAQVLAHLAHRAAQISREAAFEV